MQWRWWDSYHWAWFTENIAALWLCPAVHPVLSCCLYWKTALETILIFSKLCEYGGNTQDSGNITDLSNPLFFQLAVNGLCYPSAEDHTAQEGQNEFESHQSSTSYAHDTFIVFHDDLGNSDQSCAMWNAVLTLQFSKDCLQDFWEWPEKLLSHFCHLSLQTVLFKEKQCKVLIPSHSPVLSAFSNPYIFSYPHLHIQEEFS